MVRAIALLWVCCEGRKLMLIPGCGAQYRNGLRVIHNRDLITHSGPHHELRMYVLCLCLECGSMEELTARVFTLPEI